jgi:IclR family transcriptional regulator, KDG regulon repressor
MSQTLERGLTILDLVAERPRRISEVAEALDVHHSTALRLLHSLRRYGLVQEQPDHRYRLGAAVFRLGHRARSTLDLKSMAKPLLMDLHRETGQTVHLAALQDSDVVYVEKVESRQATRVRSRVGAVAPLHSSAVSKVILAFVPEDKRRSLIESASMTQRTPNTITTTAGLEAELAASHSRGFALDDEENEAGIRCIAAPVFGCVDRVEASISITAPTSQVDDVTLRGYLPALRDVAENMSLQMGWIGG